MPEEFQHILRVMNTNLKGEMKIWHALTSIRGVGIRYATLVCRKAEVDLNKRAGQMVSIPGRIPAATRDGPPSRDADARLAMSGCGWRRGRQPSVPPRDRGRPDGFPRDLFGDHHRPAAVVRPSFPPCIAS